MKPRPATTEDPRRVALKVLLPLASLLVVGCGVSSPPLGTLTENSLRQSVPTHQGVPAPAAEYHYSWWDDRVSDGPLRVDIDLSDQTAYMYRGDTQVGRSRVATGLPGHSTPTGTFSILEKKSAKRSNLYGRIYDGRGALVNADADRRYDSPPAGGRFVGASMPYWMRLTSSGIGMHAGPIPRPGLPASHGCIRMPEHMAQTLFSEAGSGTTVSIVP